jgi:hypothetical protein
VVCNSRGHARKDEHLAHQPQLVLAL